MSRTDPRLLWIVIVGLVLLDFLLLYWFLPREWPLVLQMAVAYVLFNVTVIVIGLLPLDDDDSDSGPPRGIE